MRWLSTHRRVIYKHILWSVKGLLSVWGPEWPLGSWEFCITRFSPCLLPLPGQEEKESNLTQLSKPHSLYYLETCPLTPQMEAKTTQRDIIPEEEPLSHRIWIFLRFLIHSVHFIWASYTTKNLCRTEFSETLGIKKLLCILKELPFLNLLTYS